jgi:hypothetical protein
MPARDAIKLLDTGAAGKYVCTFPGCSSRGSVACFANYKFNFAAEKITKKMFS